MVLERMKNNHRWMPALFLLTYFFIPSAVFAQNQILGEVEFSGASKVEKTSGVWVDGQYVGYLGELRARKKVMLLPGNHEIAVRQAGYDDFMQKILVEPGTTMKVRVRMQKAAGATWPSVTASLKVDVHPDRAAVFVDNKFIGHAGEVGGAFHSMLLSPGKHRVKVELPGYQTFESDVELVAGQKSEVKADLVGGSINQADSLIRSNSPSAEK